MVSTCLNRLPGGLGRRSPKILWVIEVLSFVELNSGALACEARTAEHHG